MLQILLFFFFSVHTNLNHKKCFSRRQCAIFVQLKAQFMRIHIVYAQNPRPLTICTAQAKQIQWKDLIFAMADANIRLFVLQISKYDQ